MGGIAQAVAGSVQQKRQPLKQANAAATSLLNQGQQLAGKINTNPFEGDFLASTNPLINAGQQGTLAVGRRIGDVNGGQSLLNLANQTARGDFLSPESNPFLQQSIDALNSGVNRNFQESIIPQFNNLLGGSNSFDNARGGILGAQLAQRNQQAIAETTAGLLNQNLARERTLQQNAPALFQAGNAQSLVPSQILSNIGREQQSDTQNQLENQRLQFQERIDAPQRAALASLPFLQAAMGLQGGTTTQTAIGNPVTGAFKGALGGLSAIKGLTAEDGLFADNQFLSGNGGKILGALGGGLLGGLFN